LRYSYNSEELREQLRGFGADADEYRKIFRARDTYDVQIAQLTGTDSATEKRRAELERMRDDSVQQAIGAERFKLYTMTQDPSFKEARDTAQENGIAPEKVLPMFQISKATDQEVARIQRDQSLTAEQREAAVKSVLEQKLASIQKVMSGTP